MITTKLDATALARPGRKDLDSELGTAGTTVGYFKDFALDTPPTIKKLERMLNNDGTVRALFQILTLPILANKHRFKPDEADELVTGSGDSSVTTHPQRDLIQNNFELPPHKGGLSIPLHSVIARMLRARLTGYMPFEKVWTKTPEGLIVYKKIAFRPADGVEILRDANGGFAGFKQYVQKEGKFEHVTIPTDKAFLFTVNQDVDPVTGESDFRTAYYSYDKKHRLYYLYERQAETGAMPPKILKPTNTNNDTKEVKEANLQAVEDFGLNTTVLLPDGYSLEPFDMGTGRLDPLPGIEHYNGEMSRSVLAQQILMGTEGKTGAYSLAETHSDILIMSLESTMRNVEQFINFYLIPQLHEYNFDKPLYCEFKYDDMTDETRAIVVDIFTKLIEKLPTGIPLEFLQKLTEQMAERLGIDVENFEPNSLVPAKTDPKPADTTNNSKGSKKKELASDKWRRPVFDYEANVDFAGIEVKMDTLETEFVDSLRPVFNKVTDQAIDDIRPLLDAADISKLDGLVMKFPNEYKNILKSTMTDGYNFAKKGASEELASKVPATPTTSKDFVNQTAQQITDKQLEDLRFIITSTVTSEFHKGQLDNKKVQLSTDDVISQLQSQFEDFFSGKIALTGGVIVSEAINRGRDDVFSKYKSKIENYTYSAILDRKTCPLCESLDGSVVTEAEYKTTRFVCPLHFLCRCIWVAVLKTDPNIPDQTGFPEDIADLIEKYQTLSKEIGNASQLHYHK
jgi:hypothetical protein